MGSLFTPQVKVANIPRIGDIWRYSALEGLANTWRIVDFTATDLLIHNVHEDINRVDPQPYQRSIFDTNDTWIRLEPPQMEICQVAFATLSDGNTATMRRIDG